MASPVEVQWELKDDSILLRAIFNGDMNTPVVNIPFSQCLKITDENWGCELPRVTVGSAVECQKKIEELEDEIESLKIADTAQERVSELENDYDELEKQYKDLRNANNILTERCEELKKDFQEADEAYGGESDLNDELNAENKQLKKKLENFESNLAQSSAFTEEDRCIFEEMEARKLSDSKNGILARLTKLEKNFDDFIGE